MTMTGDSGAATATADAVTADVAVATGPSRRPRRFSRRVREAALAYALVVPSLVVFGVFIFYPFFKNFYLGFYQDQLFPRPDKFVGFDQYRETLSSSEFFESVRTTVVFALLTVPAGIALGLALALAAHQRLRGIRVYRTIFSSTVATSVAVASVIFGTLMNPRVGLLPWLGLEPTPAILENEDWALLAVAVTTVWQNLGLSFILMAAGLQAVPDDLLEAASVDGAGPWTRFRSVVLPLLSPTIFFAVVVGSIFAFQTFGQIDLLTQGRHGTNVLTYFIFRELRQDVPDQGTAGVLAVALFAITLLLTLIQMRILERRVTYAS